MSIVATTLAARRSNLVVITAVAVAPLAVTLVRSSQTTASGLRFALPSRARAFFSFPAR